MITGNKYLSSIKANAIKLRGNYQLPSKLVYYIMQLQVDSNQYWIELLMEYATHWLRVKGYYKKYLSYEREYNDIITDKHDMLREQGVKGI